MDTKKYNEANDLANDLIYRLSKENIECGLVEEAQLVVDDFRDIIKELLREKENKFPRTHLDYMYNYQ